jgi:hypothetical protein
VEAAFSGLALAIVNDRGAFWRVIVRPTIGGWRYLPLSGESYGFGLLGGGGSVSFEMMARNAVTYRPMGASRATTVTGMGRGTGRAAVHELVHAILGASSGHSDDADSYEFRHSGRAAQYYGVLRWSAMWPLLEQRLGRKN